MLKVKKKKETDDKQKTNDEDYEEKKRTEMSGGNPSSVGLQAVSITPVAECFLLIWSAAHQRLAVGSIGLFQLSCTVHPSALVVCTALRRE